MRNALVRHWRLKAALSAALTLAFCVPYFALQQFVLFPVRHLPLSALDNAIAFNPHWSWIYQSVYLLVSLVPWLAESTEDLRRYARGFLLQAYVGFAVFLLLPVAGPRPAFASGDPIFELLLTYDSPLNSFPSLHVGLAVYTVLVAARLSSGRLSRSGRGAAIGFASIWCAAIAYSALATKQHYAIDLAAGGVLALLSFLWWWLPQPARGAVFASHTLLRHPAFERSAHAEAPGARVSAGDRSPEWSGGLVADAAGESAGGSGSPITAGIESRVRTGGA